MSVAERSVNRGRFLVTRPGDIRSENADNLFFSANKVHVLLVNGGKEPTDSAPY